LGQLNFRRVKYIEFGSFLVFDTVTAIILVLIGVVAGGAIALAAFEQAEKSFKKFVEELARELKS
jgi:hypothetical protein